VPLNKTVKLTVALTPDVGYRISAASGSGLSAPFSFSLGPCASFHGPGSCTATESFKPTTLGSASGTVTVSECPIAAGSCLPITIPVQGVGVKLATTIALSSSANPSLLNHAVTFTAKVDGASGPGNPSGTVTFADGSTTLATVAVGGGGKATFKTSALAAGTHTINAAYSGDATFAPSSASLVQTVQTAASLLEHLHGQLQGFGQGNLLAGTVQFAQQQLAAGHTRTACVALSAFLDEVHVLTRRSLTVAQAGDLIDQAQQARDAAGC
jgi:hypothetical protein